MENKKEYKPLNINKRFLSSGTKASSPVQTPPKLLTGKVNQQSAWKQLKELKHWDEIDDNDDILLEPTASQNDEMHMAALRAKQRRQEEESERLEAQQRAQKKADELAQKLSKEQELARQQTAMAREQQLARERAAQQPAEPPQKSILTRNPNIPPYNPWTARIHAQQQLQTQQTQQSPPPWRKPKVKLPYNNTSKPQPLTTKIPFYPPSSAINYKFDKIRVKLPRSRYARTINASNGNSQMSHKNQIDALDGLMDKIKSMMTPQVPPTQPKEVPSRDTRDATFNPPSKPRSMYTNEADSSNFNPNVNANANARRHSHSQNPLPSQREEFLRAATASSTSTISEPLHKSFSSH
ncbi:hypothetical protein E3Q22_04027 [Wallemia mellicola]|uniref:Uncharacterized protein n=1 Tax=Wallemia mellicola TaxID=1708541 RepID=A0A4T0LYX3_9BASI|nr:hypothetical protein E3Q22_04027 [Wallemia mellicola]TIC29377.1 hypothetical protein E3Q11_01401 [Wallemia mellicola]